jgi:hypothetical protein
MRADAIGPTLCRYASPCPARPARASARVHIAPRPARDGGGERERGREAHVGEEGALIGGAALVAEPERGGAVGAALHLELQPNVRPCRRPPARQRHAPPRPARAPRGGSGGARAARDETCPVSTEGGTRRVQLVREGGGGRGEGRAGVRPPCRSSGRARRRARGGCAPCTAPCRATCAARRPRGEHLREGRGVSD